MATVTLGTAATTTLTALVWNGPPLPADAAAISAGIKDDDIVPRPIAKTAFSRNGFLWIPNRGVLTLQRGDYVAFDPTTGWPILLSNLAAAGASWVHT